MEASHLRRVRPRRAISGMGHVGRRSMRRVARRRPWAASVLVVPHASHRLWVPARLRNGRGSDAPGVRTPSRYGSRNVTVWQVVSRHIQRRIVPPDPHRDPGPGRVDHLHHHTPVTLSKSPQPPTNTRSPTLNSEEPENVACNSANRPSRFESER